MVATRSDKTAALGVYLSMGAFCLLMGCLFSPVILLNWVALLVLTFTASSNRWATKRTLLSGLALTAAVYLVVAIVFIPSYWERIVLREKYPQQSLVERLAYERRTKDNDRSEQLAYTRVELLHEGRLQRLNQEIGRAAYEQGGFGRYDALASLNRPDFDEIHREFVHRFISAEGFGKRRVPYVPPAMESIEIPETKPVLIPKPMPKSTPADRTEPVPGSKHPHKNRLEMAAEWRSFLNLNTKGVADFVNERGFGHVDHESVESRWGGTTRVRRLDRVTGFQAHAFRKLPEPPANSDKSVRWLIEKLELVSLLKHDTPCVYESKNLPRMDELRDAPTRALDDFETGALAKLRAGEELVLHQERNSMRMLGPILAVWQCQECHSVKRGALLGAFSYRLVRDPQLPEPIDNSVSWLR